jgi:hypothetical protein
MSYCGIKTLPRKGGKAGYAACRVPSRRKDRAAIRHKATEQDEAGAVIQKTIVPNQNAFAGVVKLLHKEAIRLISGQLFHLASSTLNHHPFNPNGYPH